MKKFLSAVGEHFRKSYFYYICTVLTLGLIALGFLRFPNAIGRLVESCRDLGLSVAYTFCDLLGIETGITPTVNTLPDYSYLHLGNLFEQVKEWFLSFFQETPTIPDVPAPSPPSQPSIPTPDVPLPSKWEIFKENWALYWQAFTNEKNLLLYYYYLLWYFSIALSVVMIVIPLWKGGKKLFLKLYFREKVGVDRESLPLRIWHWIYAHVLFYIGKFFVDGFYFAKEHDTLWRFWALLAMLYFNVLTITLEFIAYYIFFIAAQELATLYTQVYKLVLDLKPFVSFVTIIGAIIFLICLLFHWSKKIGYERLEHNERKNRGFINELGIVTYIYAEMGEGKTTMLTSMGLSNEVQLRDDALEVILECDTCFPNFPWARLESLLKKAYAHHLVYDKWSCIRFVKSLQEQFIENPCRENIFGYDIDRYPLTFDNKKYVEDIWETIQDYALAYTIYTTQSALIISNYSIRVDSLMLDLGNFPIWDCDFFKRDSRLIDSFSRHSHILDYDMVRLGCQMLKDNPNRYAFGWGVWVYTELDKEAKNTLEQQEMKATDEECNQKNDLMHVMFKMSRHACMIRFRNFIRIIADMQRVENITANLRQVGQVALITDKEEKAVTLPWFSAWKIFSPALLSIKSRLDNLHVNERFLRSDERLLTGSLERIRAAIGQWETRTVGVFGCRVLKIELQTGRMDGKVKLREYAIQDKKDYAKRNGSDCMAGVFESRGELNTIGLDDMAEYADYIATQDELLKQNSYVQRELKKYEGGEMKKKETDIKEVDKLLSSTVAGLMAMQNGKIQAGAEAKKSAQLLVQSLCGVVSEWAEEKENADETA